MTRMPSFTGCARSSFRRPLLPLVPTKKLPTEPPATLATRADGAAPALPCPRCSHDVTPSKATSIALVAIFTALATADMWHFEQGHRRWPSHVAHSSG